jgi:hypothetical protein
MSTIEWLSTTYLLLVNVVPVGLAWHNAHLEQRETGCKPVMWVECGFEWPLVAKASRCPFNSCAARLRNEPSAFFSLAL